MKRRLIHDERKTKLQDDLIYVRWIWYSMLVKMRPNNTIYQQKLATVKERIDALKTLRAGNNEAGY
ncbi:hypothetical protein [Paenibacillus marinisediminis]